MLLIGRSLRAYSSLAQKTAMSERKSVVISPSLDALLASGKLSRRNVSETGKTSLLITRHSDRPALPPNSAGELVDLTPMGVERARRLGNQLRQLQLSPGALMCSPIARNLQTMAGLCETAGWSTENLITDRFILGVGGLFDSQEELEKVIGSCCDTNLTAAGIFNEIRAGRHRQFVGFYPFDIGLTNYLKYINNALRKRRSLDDRGLTVIIAHDMQIAYLISGLFHVPKFTEETWPTFLDGVLFQLDADDRLTACFADRVATVEYSLE